MANTYGIRREGKPGRVRCSCGGKVFTTPEPPTDPFYSGVFVCASCAFVWRTDNIVQSLEFIPLDVEPTALVLSVRFA